jgi:hypothetical protein
MSVWSCEGVELKSVSGHGPFPVVSFFVRGARAGKGVCSFLGYYCWLCLSVMSLSTSSEQHSTA